MGVTGWERWINLVLVSLLKFPPSSTSSFVCLCACVCVCLCARKCARSLPGVRTGVCTVAC